MTKTILFFILSGVLTLQLPSATTASNLPVTLTLPEEILAEAVSKSLPIELDTSSQSIGGSVYIKKIENLQLEKQRVSALLVLEGKNVQIVTNIAGHQLKLNIGDVLLDFDVSALLRFDPATQTLFIKPHVADLESTGANKGNDLGILLIGLLNGKEFPVKMENLSPIVTDLGNKQLAIQLKMKDIKVRKDALILNMTPEINATPDKT